MKAIICLMCQDIRGLPQDDQPIMCRCGNIVSARWVAPGRTGEVKVRAQYRSKVRVLGLHNGYLIGGCAQETRKTDSWWRALHDYVTAAPGYLFDRERRNCWAVLIQVGESDDVSWENVRELPTKVRTDQPDARDPEAV